MGLDRWLRDCRTGMRKGASAQALRRAPTRPRRGLGDYPAGATVDSTGPANGDARVLRSGAWVSGARRVRAVYREGAVRAQLAATARPRVPPGARRWQSGPAGNRRFRADGPGDTQRPRRSAGFSRGLARHVPVTASRSSASRPRAPKSRGKGARRWLAADGPIRSTCSRTRSRATACTRSSAAFRPSRRVRGARIATGCSPGSRSRESSSGCAGSRAACC